MKTKPTSLIITFLLLGIISVFFTSCKKDNDGESNTVKDFDGNVYHTVTIGTQTWMVENLKTTKYNDGTAIPLATDESQWPNINDAQPCYCWYNFNPVSYKDYGALYNWYVVNTGKLAPTGWHVPTDSDWTILIDYLGGEDLAGGKLKEIGTNHWKTPNTGATNETGFTALAGGAHYYDEFDDVAIYARFWSVTNYNTYYAMFRILSYDDSDIRGYEEPKAYGLSVRCIKD